VSAVRVWPWIALTLGLLLTGALAIPRIRRLRARRREVRRILGSDLRPESRTANSEQRTAALPARVRDSLNAWLVLRGLDPAALLGETSDRGDALRAALSLLDAVGRDRIVWDAREVRRRLRDVVETCASGGRRSTIA
jgi:hypothetical protein